jgi:hypothetical protein
LVSDFPVFADRGGTERIARCRNGPVTQRRRIKVAVLLGQPNNELRDGLTFYFVGADSKNLGRGLTRFAPCRLSPARPVQS